MDLEHEEQPLMAAPALAPLSVVPVTHPTEDDAERISRAVSATLAAPPPIFPESDRVRRAVRPEAARITPPPIAQRVQPMQRSSRAVIHRQVAKGEGWTASMGWVPGRSSQEQIDTEFKKLTVAWSKLNSAVQSADGLLKKVGGKEAHDDDLDRARATRDRWVRTDTEPGQVNWDDRTKVLATLTESLALVGEAPSKKVATNESTDETVQGRLRAEEVLLREEISHVADNVAKALMNVHDLRTAAKTVKVVTPATLDKIGDVGNSKLKTILKTIQDDSLRKKVFPVGGEKLYGIVDAENMNQTLLSKFVAGSTTAHFTEACKHFDGDDIVDLTTSYTAKTVCGSLLTPLGPVVSKALVENLAADWILILTKLFRIVDDGGPETIKGLVQAGHGRIGGVWDHRQRLSEISERLPDRTKIGDHWKAMTDDSFSRLTIGAEGDETVGSDPEKSDTANTKLAGLLDQTDTSSTKSFVTTMTREQLLAHKTRLGDLAYNGWTKTGIKGDDFHSIMLLAATHDGYLTALGATHQAKLKACVGLVGSKVVARWVEGCAGKVNAAKAAKCIGIAGRLPSKKQAETTTFFANIGASLEAVMDAAALFFDAGNHGQHVTERPGGGGSDTALATKNQWAVAGGDIAHYCAGHSYYKYVMTDVNASRPASTMWPVTSKYTEISGDATGVLANAAFNYAAPAAVGWNPGEIVGTFTIGLDHSRSRVTQMYPTGGHVYSPNIMRSVVRLMKTKG